MIHLINGLRVLLKNKKGYNSVQVSIGVGVGAYYPNAQKPGIAHILEHNVFLGTQKYTKQEIDLKLNDVGAKIDAFTGDMNTIFTCRTFNKNIKIVMDILIEIVFNYRFNKSLFKNEKKIIKNELMNYYNYSMSQNAVSALKTYYKNAKICLNGNGIGNNKDIDNITLQDLENFSKQFYNISNAVIVVCGNFDEREIIKFIKIKTNQLTNKQMKIIKFSETDIGLVNNKDIIINNIKKYGTENPCPVEIIFKGVNYLSVDKYKYMCFSNMLAGINNQKSLIKEKLREDLGLIYNCEANLDSNVCVKNGGTFHIRFFVDKKNINKGILELFKLLIELKKNRFKPTLKTVKNIFRK